MLSNRKFYLYDDVLFGIDLKRIVKLLVLLVFRWGSFYCGRLHYVRPTCGNTFYNILYECVLGVCVCVSVLVLKLRNGSIFYWTKDRELCYHPRHLGAESLWINSTICAKSVSSHIQLFSQIYLCRDVPWDAEESLSKIKKRRNACTQFTRKVD